MNRRLCLATSSPMSPSEAPSSASSRKPHRMGPLTACFGCQGKKVRVQKPCHIHPPTPVAASPSPDPFPRQLWAAEAEKWNWQRQLAGGVWGVGSGEASHLSTLGPFHRFPSIPVGVWQTEMEQAREASLSRHSGMPLTSHPPAACSRHHGAQPPKLDQPCWAPSTRPSLSIWKRFESLKQKSSLLHFKGCGNWVAWVLVWFHEWVIHFLKVNCSPFGSGPGILGCHVKCH